MARKPRIHAPGSVRHLISRGNRHQDIFEGAEEFLEFTASFSEAAKKGGRQDVADQAEEELAIVNAYLPQQLSPEALKQLIDEAVQSAGANQGQVMKYVMQKAAGAADGKLVSQLVAERLKQGAKA